MTATRAELERVLAGAGFQEAHDFRIRAAADGEVTIEVPFRKAFERPGGVVSGPVFMAAAMPQCGWPCSAASAWRIAR
jgi:acyl-coenzyme A thioesterase PaaI-like protein